MKSFVPSRGALLAVVLLAACDAGGSVNGPSVPAEIRAAAAVSQTAVVGTRVPDAPAVRVMDQRGQPKQGVEVKFTVSAGGGSVANVLAVTDAAGNAGAGSWTLGSQPGTQSVTATVARLDPLTFTATAEARRAASVSAASATAQAAPVRTPVAAPPSVRVADQVGQPLAGVPVTFAVTGGGGAVAGATATTGADGVATAGGWTLGPGEGENTLTATVAGLTHVAFTATGQPRVPAGLSADVTPRVGVPGAPVAEPPFVVVTDQVGDPLAGVPVSFAVTGGGGTVSPATVATDASGRAQAGTWTLGASPGTNTLTATVAGLPPMEFTATAQAPRPAGFAAASLLTQTGTAGEPVTIRPAVLVTDQGARPLPGVVVTFAVTGGGGTVTGGSATTGADGIARVGSWTLGAAGGANTLTASLAGFTSITFTAQAPARNPCTARGIAVGAIQPGSLMPGDCQYQTGEYVDLYAMTFPTARQFSMRLGSTAFQPLLELFTVDGDPVAFHADGSVFAHLRVFARPDSYLVGATTLRPGQTGSYEIRSEDFSSNEQCQEYWTTAGLLIPGRIAATDCNAGGMLSDEYVVYLRAGQTLTLRMESTELDAYLELYGNMGTLVAEDDDGAGGTDARLVYTATSDFAFTIVAGTFAAGETGTYVLSVATSGGTSGASVAADGAVRPRLRGPAPPTARDPARRAPKR